MSPPFIAALALCASPTQSDPIGAGGSYGDDQVEWHELSVETVVAKAKQLVTSHLWRVSESIGR